MGFPVSEFPGLCWFFRFLGARNQRKLISLFTDAWKLRAKFNKFMLIPTSLIFVLSTINISLALRYQYYAIGIQNAWNVTSELMGVRKYLVMALETKCDPYLSLSQNLTESTMILIADAVLVCCVPF
jgi:hypothetical protein